MYNYSSYFKQRYKPKNHSIMRTKQVSGILSKVSAEGMYMFDICVSSAMVVIMLISLVNQINYTSKVAFSFMGFLTNLISYFIIIKVQKGYVNGVAKSDKEEKNTVGWLTITFAAIIIYLLATKLGIF